MAAFDLLVRDGTVVQGEPVVGDIAIADGRIVAVGPDLSGSAPEEIDARGLHIFPGVIDAHVHFNEPGRTEWEGWATGSRALAAGGATTCFEMPLNANPPTTTVAAFDEKRRAAEASSVVDFALWGGIVPGNLDELDGLAAAGAIGFKAFMSRSGTPEFEAADDLTLFEGMRAAARLGRIVAVHAESDALTAGLAARAVAEGRTGVHDYLRSRPAVAELEAIGRAIVLAEEAGCALHIVHVSTGRGVAMVAEAQARGVDVTCETCAHYLVFTEEDVERIGAVAKCAPPIRSDLEREALWAAIAVGRLPIVTSDHSPSPAALKTGEDFFRIWGGISGCQSTLPALLTAGHHHRSASLPTIAALVAGNVARRFGLARKGRIAPGADADLALVDLNAAWQLTADDLQYRHRLSPYVGMTFRGRIVRTNRRGETIFERGRFPAVSHGRLITSEPGQTVD